MQPKIIIITVYHGRKGDSRFNKREDYLVETIKSVNQQKMNNAYHLLIDDGSTDDAMTHMQEKFPANANRHYFKRPKRPGEPLSSTNARNFGIELCLSNVIPHLTIAKNDYITFIDSDDVVINLNSRFDFLLKGNYRFGISDCLLLMNGESKARTWKGISGGTAQMQKKFWVHGILPYPTMTWRVDFLQALQKYILEQFERPGIFDPTIGCGEDVDVAYSSLKALTMSKSTVGYLPKITAGYRIHDTSLATIRNQVKRKYEENSVLKRHNGIVTTYILHLRRLTVRPECYFPYLYRFKNNSKSKVAVIDYIPNWSAK